MPRPNYIVEPQDLEHYDWNSELSAADCLDSWSMHMLAKSKADELEANADTRGCAVFWLFADVFSMSIDFDSPIYAFHPFFSTPEGRSTLPQDFEESQLYALETCLNVTFNVGMKARVAHILMIRKHALKPHVWARIASESYAALSKLRAGENWKRLCLSYAKIALRIACTFSLNDQIDALYRDVENMHTEFLAMCDLHLVTKTTELCREYKIGSPHELARSLERLVDDADSSNGAFEKARSLDAASKLFARVKDYVSVNRCKMKAAEGFLHEGESKAENEGSLVAERYVGEALARFKKIKGTEVQRNAAHTLLLRLQAETQLNMSSVTHDIDHEACERGVVELLADQPFQEVCIKFATQLVPVRSRDFLRKEALALVGEFPLQHMFGRIVYDENDMVVSRRAGILPGEDLPEEFVVERMIDYLKLDIICWYIRIERARKLILNEHFPSLPEVVEMCTNNIFVPENCILTMARGLHLGMHGDWMLAMSLLIPQIEHMFRHVLNSSGIVTTEFDANSQTQKQADLTDLLSTYRVDIENLLGGDLIFHFEALLTRTGFNLRHNFAHGNFKDSMFNNQNCVYLWWLVWRYVAIGYKAARESLE